MGSGSGDAARADGVPPSSEGAQGPSVARGAPRRPRLFLLEDNLSLARGTRRALRVCADVTIVATARAAMDRLAQDEAWNGFICDIGLPDGSGLDVLREARAVRPTALALAISGSMRQGDINAACALGAQYLAKPFREAEIVGVVERHLRSSWPPADPEGGPGEECAAELGALPRELRGLVADVRTEDARIGQADARRAYRLANLAKAASALPSDTATTFDACAQAARVSRQTLQEYATLTTRWSPEDVAWMLGLTDRNGKALTRAHLLRFARGPCEVRMEFDAAVATRSFDIEELQAKLREAKRR